MSFAHFTDERLSELWRGLVDANLIPRLMPSAPRPAEPGDGSAMTPARRGSAAETRVLAELKGLNTIKRSQSGQVPLLLWLRNAVTLSEGLPLGLLFRQALSDLAARVTGQMPIPDPAKFPEYYANLAHPPDILSQTFLTGGGEACGGVARLCVPRFDGGRHTTFNGYPLVYDGTAWLITPSLLVTSYHVVNARSFEEGHSAQPDLRRQVAHSVAEFITPVAGGQAVQLGVASLEICHRQLDFVVLRLAQPARGRALRMAADRASSEKDTGMPVNLITCPASQLQQIFVRGNVLSAVTNKDVRFLSLSIINPLGAPVFNDSWQVIALHRGATIAEGINYQGRTAAWLNVGTHITAILKYIRGEQPTLWEEIQAEGRLA